MQDDAAARPPRDTPVADVSHVDVPFRPAVMQSVTIELTGPPKGKGRPRFARATGHAYTPQSTRSYEAALRYAAQVKMAGKAPIEGPLRIEALFAFPVPVSWSNKRRADALAGLVRPTGKPDIDNLIKSLGDAFNGVVWRDDSQVVTAQVAKRYSDHPRLWVQVEAI